MSEKKSNNGITKVLVSFPNDTLDRISELAKKNGMTRSSMVNYAIKWYLDYKNSMDLMPVLMDLARMEPEKLKEKADKLNKNLK